MASKKRPSSGGQHRARRARFGSLNASKTTQLAFVHQRLSEEAALVAACCLDLWERTGSIPSQAGTYKLVNIPGAALGQGLWTQVAGQLTSALSNAENALAQLIRRYAQPNAVVPPSPMQERLLREALARQEVQTQDQEGRINRPQVKTGGNASLRAACISPLTPISTSSPPSQKGRNPAPRQRVRQEGRKAARRRMRREHMAAWQRSRDDTIQAALNDFQALELSHEQASEQLWAVMHQPARRQEGQAHTPAERLVRALWLQVLDRHPLPNWRKMAWVLSPNAAQLKPAHTPEERTAAKAAATYTASTQAAEGFVHENRNGSENRAKTSDPSDQDSSSAPIASPSPSAVRRALQEQQAAPDPNGNANGKNTKNMPGAQAPTGLNRAKRHHRPRAPWVLELQLPVPEAWPAAHERVREWRQAVVEAPVYDTTSEAALQAKADRKKLRTDWKTSCAEALAQGQPLPAPPVIKYTERKKDGALSRSERTELLLALQAAGLSAEEAAKQLRTQAPAMRKVKTQMTTLSLPVFAGDLDQVLGTRANSVILLPPNIGHNRADWQARIIHVLNAEDLAQCAERAAQVERRAQQRTEAAAAIARRPIQASTSALTLASTSTSSASTSKAISKPTLTSTLKAPSKPAPAWAGARPGVVLALDAGVRVGFTTNVGLESGPDLQRGVQLTPHGEVAPEGLLLTHLLQGWGERLKPLIDRAWKAKAGRQRQGLPITCKRTRRLEVALAGRIKCEMETALKRTMVAVRPSVVVIEDLDLRGGRSRLSADTNRKVQRMGFGVLRSWLERNAAVFGYTLQKENPAYTSQQCLECGHIEASNRNGGRFKCVCCAFEEDADRVGSANVGERFSWTRWLASLGEALPAELSGTRIESWMPPQRVRLALDAREAFLRSPEQVAAVSERVGLPDRVLAQTQWRSRKRSEILAAPSPERSKDQESNPGSDAIEPELHRDNKNRRTVVENLFSTT